MKLLIFSDSHGDVAAMRGAVEAEQPGAVLHLGDHIADAERLEKKYPDMPIYKVLGNMDKRGAGEWARHIELCGKRIFMTHGHTFLEDERNTTTFEGVSRLFLSEEGSADILLFGHTHEPFLNCCNGKWIMNPGCASAAYGVLEIAGGKVQWRFQEV
ncbi:MAG: YfcE family phosphodiesterase [Oscillospiraceae bacterium]|jgi:putative phosphoesterase|nr:YfcE family phosphodiesterase [Oscillospiraceae bacterium]